jgi:hypothetical protein
MSEHRRHRLVPHGDHVFIYQPISGFSGTNRLLLARERRYDLF